MTIIKHRRGTAAEWAASNRVLEYGELGIEYDTYRLKIGDGTKAWSELPYAVNEITIQDILVAQQAMSDAANSAAAAAQSEADTAQALQDAIDLSGISTTDDAVSALILNTGGAGPKTSAALDDEVEERVLNALVLKTDTYISATEPVEATDGDFWYQP